jgi:GT2 family glycosyltransferase/glycosyltransferase involved in cell wall biosynthesis
MSTIAGQVDRFEGQYVTGWAIELPYVRACRITLLLADGTLVGQGKANVPREDLSALGHGRDNFAFRVPVAGLEDGAVVRVLANDAELGGSPLTFKSGVFDGFLQVNAGDIDGWVAERGGRASAPLVTLVGPDGRTLGTLPSRLAPDADPLFAPARFRGPLPDACFGRDEAQIEARVGPTAFARTRARTRLQGYLDLLTPEHCAGWLYSPDLPERRFEIVVRRDGVEVGRAACRVARDDLASHVQGRTDVGFDIPFDTPHRSETGLCRLSLRLPDSELELFGGPFLAGRRPAVLGGLREAAQTVFSGELPDEQRAVLQAAFSQFARHTRAGGDYVHLPMVQRAAAAARRLVILVPVYRGTEVTRACIESVLRHRDPATDRLVVINDASPEADMALMLARFEDEPNTVFAANETNLGFVRTVNRGLGLAREGDVILLNSDTVVFPGALDELWSVAHAATDVGTATALSNNATIFSYPHAALTADALDDISWDALAAVARRANAGQSVTVPTGHGFCMLIKRELLDRLGTLDESFGRGYGEENEFCLRAQDLGYRHVAATGAFVQHRESVSFGGERAGLLRTNQRILQERFPEYTAQVMAFERTDPLRRGRWALDAHRLERAVAAGSRFALVVGNWLGGGTDRAAADIERLAGYEGAVPLRLSNREDGLVELGCQAPTLRAVFLAAELDPLFGLLEAAAVDLVVVHQLLGYEAGFVRHLTDFAARRRSVAWIHDYYPICPRVTLMDAIGRFCGVADADTCGRCVRIGGAHEATRMAELAPAEHRVLMAGFYAACGRVVVPSLDTALHLKRALPRLEPKVLPHLQPDPRLPRPVRAGNGDDVVLIGALGPHKGSAKLLEIATLASLAHPRLHFHVVGYTNIDAQLKRLGNVSITGRYDPADLPALLAATRARLALFLQSWPETFSYTLTEAVLNGLLPMVPDIGAPADRVRAAGIGLLFPFPIDAAEVLRLIDSPETRDSELECTPEALAQLNGSTRVEDVAELWRCEPALRPGTRPAKVLKAV